MNAAPSSYGMDFSTSPLFFFERMKTKGIAGPQSNSSRARAQFENSPIRPIYVPSESAGLFCTAPAHSARSSTDGGNDWEFAKMARGGESRKGGKDQAGRGSKRDGGGASRSALPAEFPPPHPGGNSNSFHRQRVFYLSLRRFAPRPAELRGGPGGAVPRTLWDRMPKKGGVFFWIELVGGCVKTTKKHHRREDGFPGPIPKKLGVVER